MRQKFWCLFKVKFRPAQTGSPVRNVGLNFHVDSCPFCFYSIQLFYCYSVVAASIFYRKVPDYRNNFYPDF